VLCLYGQAPGRVNIIGEHVDYNDGFIMPFAIDKTTKVHIRESRGEKYIISSSGFEEKAFQPVEIKKSGDWTDYVKGAIFFLTREFNMNIPPVELHIESTVPLGAGLSSSAAIEVATLMAINGYMGLEMEEERIYRLAQQIENDFVGVKCGIMDQFISVMGKAGKAVFLDTMTMEHQYVDLKLESSGFFIIDSNVKHALGDGEYNKRREECESALKKLKKSSFREISIDELEENKKHLTPEEYKRSLHVLTENERVLACRQALEKGWESKAGEILLQSHESLRDHYEVSCGEIDYLVEAFIKMEKVNGARIMGGGFGGSLIVLADKTLCREDLEGVAAEYKERYKVDFELYSVTPSEGAVFVE